MTHKHEDLKLTAVRYYLDNDTTYAETCRIFNCSERILKRWIDRFQDENKIKRHNREPISYKVNKEHVDYAIRILRSNEQITMVDLNKILRDQFEDFDITPQHLGQILRDNNKTRKRSRKEHFPETRYGRSIDKQSELNKFYKKVDEYRLDKIICLDETSIQLGMYPTFSRCNLGKRCIINSNNNNVFKKYTLLSAISSTGIIGYKLYENGGMTTDRFVNFINDNINGRYRNHLIIIDNAGAHRKQEVKDVIRNGGNELLYTIPYTPKTNAIENWFSQLKHYLKKDGVLSFDLLKQSVRNAIRKIKPENYLNYFSFAYRKEAFRKYEKKKSTRYRSPKSDK